jgi:hypothetical protein
LSGIFLYFQKDSRRASLAGMTNYEASLMNSLVFARDLSEQNSPAETKFPDSDGQG